ncbi:MAG: sugar phosphate isomerase/epimerase, partial [Flavisolibacter sp.]|nr:sugar phosphate isomerase/epimerase [Flavisolibacter sp.]
MAAPARRKFLRTALTFSALPLVPVSLRAATEEASCLGTNRFKISLNAYSFNAPLTNGKTTLPEVLEFCAAQGFDAVDLTGYYFPRYPEAPPDDYVYQLKRKAHHLGLAISGTGVRNDFTLPD